MKRKMMIGCMLSACLMLFSAFAFMPQALATQVAITKAGNPMLYAALIKACPNTIKGTGDVITITELNNTIGQVNLSNSGITDITGLEYINASTLILSKNNGLTSITPLTTRAMTSLDALYIDHTGITVLPIMTNLSSLINLDISYNNMSSILRITALTNLQYLNATKCGLTIFSPLTDLTKLQNINLNDNNITDLPADLSKLTVLTSLNLGNNKTLGASQNLARLGALHNLQSLTISNTGIHNVSYLKTDTKLTLLDWGNNNLSLADLDTMAQLPKTLQSLSVDYSTSLGNGCIQKIRADFPNLKSLYVSNDGITDASGLAGLDLTTLYLSENRLSNISVVSGMANLSSLSLDNTLLYDISALAHLNHLTEVMMGNDYLDLTSTSSDMAVINALPAGCSVSDPGQFQVDVSYSCDAGKGAAANTTPVTLYYEQWFTPPAVTPNGPTIAFEGWDANGDGKADLPGGKQIQFYNPTTVPPLNSNALALTAVLDTRYYAVHFDSQGGSAIVDGSVQYSSVVAQPTPPTRTGYTFGGWFKAKDYLTEWNFSNDKVIADITLYAKWTANPFVVTFDDQVGNKATETVLNDSLATQPFDPARSGYVFDGWCKDAAGTQPWNFTTDKVTGDVTLYAKWITLAQSVNLTGIKLSAGALSPAFSAAGAAYTVNLGETVGSVTVTPQLLYSKATLTINGSNVASKTVSVASSASATVTVKVANGSVTKTVTLTIKRAKSTNATLSALKASAGKLAPAFKGSVLSYTLTLPEGTATTKITATKAVSAATVTPASKTLTLANGASATVTFKVKAQSGATKTYTVKVTRAKSTNAKLASLKTGSGAAPLKPMFSPATLSYKVALPSGTSSITVTAAAADKLSSITINGSAVKTKKFTLAHGQTVKVMIVVKAQSGATKTYTVTIKRA